MGTNFYMDRILITGGFTLLFSFLLLATAPLASAQDYFWQDEQEATFLVREITVEGNQRVEENTVRSYMNINVGDRVGLNDIDASIKALFATGLFADVAMSPEGNTLNVRVAENPVINEIAFEGNKAIDDEELLSEISMRPRTVLSRTKVQNNVERLYEIYRRGGRFSTSIDPKVIMLDQNRVNLVFEIDEGSVTKIRKVSFVGNKEYTDDQLREAIASKEKRFWRFLTSADRYDADRVNFDQELLRRFYLANGYVDFQVRSAVAELSEDRDTFYLTFTVDEGERYKVAKIDIRSKLKNYDASGLNELVTFEEGEWYDADRVQSTVEDMVSELGNQQYAFVDVRPTINRNTNDRTVNILFTVNETPRVFVERIDIKGNVRTLDKVIRREFELVEGDPFNREKIAKSERNIRDLGFFETLSVTPKPGTAADKTVIETTVAEQSTGEVSIGAGFSTTDGPLADFRIRERNLLGTGRDLGFTTVIAGERTEFDVSLSEPYFLNRDLRATADIFRITRDFQDESSFDQRRTGAGFSLNYPLSERLRQTVRYRFEQNTIEDVSANASLFIRLQEGERATSAISQRLTYDARDSRLFTTEGYHLWFDTELAGLAGDAKYLSGKVGGEYFYEIVDNWVVNVLGEVAHIQGYGDEDVTISERFFLGGTTLRGFERSGVGPRDLVTDDSLGGNSFYRGTVELTAPLNYGPAKKMGINWHAFSDFGSLFGTDESNLVGGNLVDDSSLRASVGVGFSWRSPFGPLRLDFSKPVAKEDYDVDEVFQFNFGTRF